MDRAQVEIDNYRLVPVLLQLRSSVSSYRDSKSELRHVCWKFQRQQQISESIDLGIGVRSIQGYVLDVLEIRYIR